jgi:hsp70-interacting protein
MNHGTSLDYFSDYKQALESQAVPKLAEMTTEDPDKTVRQKAIYALSSEIRNFQPAFEAALEVLPAEFVDEKVHERPSAIDMGYIDSIMSKLRESSNSRS